MFEWLADILHRGWGTVLVRPYVFMFLISYLAVSLMQIGWRRTLVFALLGFLFGFGSEYLSVRTGFPYGGYDYLSEATRDKELWLGGVPAMASLSFIFLTYAGYMTGLLAVPLRGRPPRGDPGASGTVVAPVEGRGLNLRFADLEAALGSRWALLLGPLFTVLLDVVIDPVALRGEHFFLGRLYRYHANGFYFGVPLSNFAGWLLVSFLIFLSFQVVDRWFRHFPQPGRGKKETKQAPALPGLALYVGILAFIVAVTFGIGAVKLGLISSALSLGAVGLVWRRLVGYTHRKC